MSNLHQLRVIAGIWRGRKINFTPQNGLRPTPDRVRETLFNWLMPYIQNTNCLDLFAGSGILGIEALSRGANHVTAIDLSKTSSKAINDNLTRIGIKDYTFIQQDVLKWLAANDLNYDIIFLDPPFKKDLIKQTLTTIHEKANPCLVYTEQEEQLDPSYADKFEILKQKKAGKVFYHLLKLVK